MRDAIGDHKQDNASAYDLSDATLDAIYDDADQGSSDLTLTIVWALRRRWARAINAVNLSGEFGNASHGDKQKQIKTLLDYWEGVAGITGGQSIGSSVATTYRADSRQTEAPDYSNGTASDGDRFIVINY